MNTKSYIIVDFGNLPKDVLALFENDTTDFDLFLQSLFFLWKGTSEERILNYL